MLRNTFCHIEGVGLKTEQKLWAAGILRWEQAVGASDLPVGGWRGENVMRCAAESAERLAARDGRWFYDGLPPREQWRLFEEFRDGVAYVDIETTGLGGPYDHITTIALYDGRHVQHYVHGENLEDFGEDICECELLVTYNGKQFDVPFLRDDLGVHIEQPHIDLRYVLGSLGFKGGLKGCERQFGLDRGELDGVDGFFAVHLWQAFRQSASRAVLDTLLAYNVADTVNLEPLMVAAYNMKVEEAGFAHSRSLPLPEPPPNPFRADPDVIARIRRTMGWRW